MRIAFNEEDRTPIVGGFMQVTVMQPARIDDARLLWAIQYHGVRESDGLEIHGQLVLTEKELNDNRNRWDEFKRDALGLIRATLSSYADCNCRIWWDSQTRQTYLLDCDNHAEKRLATGEGTGAAISLSTYPY